MQEILQEMKFVPGVVGTMVFVEKKDIVFSNIPNEFDDFLMEQTGRVVGRILSIRDKLCENIDNLTIAFREYTLICFSIKKGAVLIVLGDNTVRPDLVAMTATGMVTELAAGIEDREPASPPKAAPKGGAKEMPPALEIALPKLRDELTRYIGPVAPLVLDGYIQNCLKSGQDENTCWKKFEEAILSEIDDTSDRAAFKQKFTNIVTSARAAENKGPSAAPVSAGQATGESPSQPQLEAKTLRALEAIMAKSIGPIAAMIVSDTVKKWQRNPSGGPGELIEMLAQEIDDKKDQKIFRDEARKILQ